MPDTYDALIKSESGLQTYLACDEPSGTTANDTSPNALNYTATGTVTVNSASVLPGFPASKSFLFNTGYLSRATNTALHPGDVFTYEVWLKRTAIGGGVNSMALSDIAANEHNLQFVADDTLKIRKDSVADVFVTTAAYTDTTNPHHLVFTKNGATYAIYYDGASQTGTNVGNQTMVASTGNPDLMAALGGTAPILAYAAKIAMYNVALSATQVLAHYNLGFYGTLVMPVQPSILSMIRPQ